MYFLRSHIHGPKKKKKKQEVTWRSLGRTSDPEIAILLFPSEVYLLQVLKSEIMHTPQRDAGLYWLMIWIPVTAGEGC